VYQQWVQQANFAYQLTDLIRKPIFASDLSPKNEGGLSTTW